jgi:hypothetical protein
VTTIINGSSPSITFSDGSAQTSATRPFLNRIINGAMVIDQRNAGASVTVNNGSSNFFITDRWFANGENSDGVFTGQQVTTAPTGFNNSLQFTVTTADASIGATQGYTFRQRIEGFNFADCGWGTANAKTVTLSFWVRSSLTGTFGGSLFNGNGDRAYAFSFSISSANTFEYKTVTIAGDTTGTWSTTNGTALNLVFSLGVGSTYKGTAGSWGSTLYLAPTGSVDLISTLSATFFLTGVQLEVGSTATSFDYRPYGTELALCQRYYYRIKAAAAQQIIASSGLNYATNGSIVVVPYPVPLRTAPTALEQSGTAGDYRLSNATGSSVTCTAVPDFSSASIAYGIVNTTVNASTLVAGYSNFLFGVNTNAYLGWSAEL